MKYRLLPFLMILLCLSSCLGPDDLAEERAVRAKKATGEILIGAVAPWSTLDVLRWEGIEMAVDEINAAGGILEREIRVVKRDDNGSIKKRVRIAQGYAENPDVVSVIGDYSLSGAMDVSVVYQYYGILFLSMATAEPKLTRKGFSLIFQMAPDATVYGNALTEFCLKQGYKRILVYQEIGVAGRTRADAFVIAAQEGQVEILDRKKYTSFANREDFQRFLVRAKQRYDFDALVFFGRFSQCVAFIDAAEESGIEKPIILGRGLKQAEFIKKIATYTGKVCIPTTFEPDSSRKDVQSFVQAFKMRYGMVPDSSASHAYDTVYTLAYAIKQAGSTVPSKMAEALHSAKGFAGLTGPVSFDVRGNRLGTNIAFKVIKNGRSEYFPSGDGPPADRSK